MALQPLTSLPETKLIIKRALLSVSDKTGIKLLANALHQTGVELLSTGGTAAAIREAGIPVKDVSEITGFPECLDGRVKTLHPHIHAGILARTSHDSDNKQLEELNIQPIEMVVVNLYPFAQTVADPTTQLAKATEFIDIGGPTMVRAAAKNFGHVAVLTDPQQYQSVIDEIGLEKGVSYKTRFTLAREAFHHTASYDVAIANYLDIEADDKDAAFRASVLKSQDLRYGENPHQAAAVYGSQTEYIDCFHGKELSYNNFLDVDAALRLIADFEDNEPTVAIFKHTVPCGVAMASTLLEAYNQAFDTDKVSPFGGIVIVNKPLDMDTAKAIDSIFTEIIIAYEYEDGVIEFLQKKANRRLIRIKKSLKGDSASTVKSIFGGYLKQDADSLSVDFSEFRDVAKRKPNDAELRDLEFAWKVVKHVKSNAIVYVKNGKTLGIGTGQTSRVDASEIAVRKALKEGHDLTGCVIASDAFFPFADGVEAAAEAGVTAVIQPGGSIRDAEVIKVADNHNLAMLFTGRRHFRH